ncbi:MAG: alpha/beta hydrolase, partial [bacterium]|nr:alpha/beta hydrolase [bacterium]
QSLEDWLKVYQRTRQLADGHPSIIIGHSIGATFALRLLEINLNGPREAVFLVSGLVGPLEEKEETKKFNKLNQTFYEEQFRWDKISAASKAFFVYHGTDDPYVPMHHADVIANGLGKDVEVTKIHGGGHINTESGFTKFERLWQDLKPLLDTEA